MDAQESITDLEAELETARIRRESALYVEEKEIQLNTAKLKVREVINSELLNAIGLYLDYAKAERDAESAKLSFSTAEKEYKIAEERYAVELVTEKELLNESISLMQSRKSLAGAERNLEKALVALIRALNLNTESRFDTDISWIKDTPAEIVIDFDEIKVNSSEYFKAFYTVQLKQKQLTAKANSKISTPDEIETAEDDLENAEDQLQSVIWNLEDEKINQEYQLLELQSNFQISEMNLQLSQMDLEQTELQHSFGELYETDLENARKKLLSSEIGLIESREDHFQLYLQAVDLVGGDCNTVIADWITDVD